MPDLFSQRHGLSGPPPGTLLRNEVPVSFRMFLVDLPYECFSVESRQLHKVVCEVLQVWPDEKLSPYYDYKRHIQKCEWFRIYEIIEGLYRVLYGKNEISSFPSDFVKAINDAFIAQNIGWQLDRHGKVVTRGNEVFERTINTAVSILQNDHKTTAAKHLRSAIAALSVKPKTNTSGAVSHATNAVECVLGEITGEATTLGKYLVQYPDLFHPALRKGVNGIYGYASDEGARHGKEGTEPALEEAEFVVASCAAICTLLTKRHPK